MSYKAYTENIIVQFFFSKFIKTKFVDFEWVFSHITKALYRINVALN